MLCRLLSPVPCTRLALLARLVPVALCLAACAGQTTVGPEVPSAGPEVFRSDRERQDARAHELPPNWRDAAALAFERDVLAPLLGAAPARLNEPDLAALAAGLAQRPGVAVRASVLLGRCGDPSAAAALLARLEQRVLAPAREDDAGDCVAAAALALDPPGAREHRAAARLAALSAGPLPHPDLEVRVECAAAALALGSDEPIPFLLQVLRIETPPGRDTAGDFQVSPTTAWARGRAAEALSARAGVPCTWSPDAPIAVRVRGAERLEELLGGIPIDS